MARVSLVETGDAETEALIDSLRQGRGGRLINIYKMLLHSPALARQWFEFNNAVRWGTELDGKTREAVIIRIAYLNRVDYVIQQHVMRLAAPEGLTEEQCMALAEWRPSPFLDDRLHAALELTDAMTKDVDVPDEVIERVRAHFSERQLVELAVLIGFYNMHTRVLAALKIDPEPEHSGGQR